jgi:hypothetical protein
MFRQELNQVRPRAAAPSERDSLCSPWETGVYERRPIRSVAAWRGLFERYGRKAASRTTLESNICRFCRCLPKKQISSGLKSVRDDKNKDLYGTARSVPFQNIVRIDFFRRAVKPCPFKPGLQDPS